MSGRSTVTVLAGVVILAAACGTAPARTASPPTSRPTTSTSASGRGGGATCASVTPGQVPVRAGDYPLAVSGTMTITTPHVHETLNLSEGHIAVLPPQGDLQTQRIELQGDQGLTLDETERYRYATDGAHLHALGSSEQLPGLGTLQTQYMPDGPEELLPSGGDTGEPQRFRLVSSAGSARTTISFDLQCRDALILPVGPQSVGLPCGELSGNVTEASPRGRATSVETLCVQAPSPLPVRATVTARTDSSDGATVIQTEYSWTRTTADPM